MLYVAVGHYRVAGDPEYYQCESADPCDDRAGDESQATDVHAVTQKAVRRGKADSFRRNLKQADQRY